MKEFEVTLTAVSKKTFKLRADSHEDAFLLAEAILENSDLLNFSDEDVDSMDMTCEEQCGGVCDTFGSALYDCQFFIIECVKDDINLSTERGFISLLIRKYVLVSRYTKHRDKLNK